MFKVFFISLGLVALSAAGGFFLSVGHDTLMNNPRLSLQDTSAASTSELRSHTAVASVEPDARTMTDMTATDAPLTMAASANVAPATPSDDAAGDPVISTRSYDVYGDMGRTDLAPQNSARPRARDPEPAQAELAQAEVGADQSGEPAKVARPMQDDTRNQIVLTETIPHEMVVTYTSPNPVQSYETPEQSSRPRFEPVPRYLIGVFR